MVEYLAAFVGQSFSAVISGVAAWGLYVRLDCTAEGILPVRALGDSTSSSTRCATRLWATGREDLPAGPARRVTLKSDATTTASLEFVLAGSR